MKPTCGNLVKPDGTPAKYEDRADARICGRVASMVWEGAMNLCEGCGSALQAQFEAQNEPFRHQRL